MTSQSDIAPTSSRPGSAVLPLLVLCYALCAILVNAEAYAALLPVYGRQATIFPLLLVPGMGVVALLASPKAPLAFILTGMRHNGLRLLSVVALFTLGLTAFTTFKVTIPKIVPFYADPIFAQLDLLIHGGDPGVWLHAVLPGWSSAVFMHLYGLLWVFYWFGMLMAVALLARPALRRQYYWSMALTIALLGTVAAGALSSVGPIFYENVYGGGRYGALLQALEQSPAGDNLLMIGAYLWRSYETQSYGAGTGISAMPSMHLAIVTLNAWTVTALVPRLAPLAWAYVAAILTGSVFLAWHYAVDGYFSILVVSLIWHGLRWVLRARTKFEAIGQEPLGSVT